jgi:hypothetical protein
MKKYGKRAQNVGQIFVYVLSIVVVGVILLFGYNGINSLIKKFNQIDSASFEKDLNSFVTGVSPEFGTLKARDFKVPSQVKKVCFVRNYKTDESGVSSKYNPTSEPLFGTYPLIKENIEIGGSFPQPLKNVFLILDKKEVVPLKKLIGKLSFDGDIVAKCFDVKNSRLSIKAEGKGDHAVIS